MSNADLRRMASKLADTDPEEAYKKAMAIGEPWYRAQALAAVARLAPTTMLDKIFRDAVKAAHAAGSEKKDDYRYVAVSGWVLSAMVKRGKLDWLARELHQVLVCADRMQHAVNRSDALVRILIAVRPLEIRYHSQIIKRLAECEAAGTSWRCARNLAWAASHVAEYDRAESLRLIGAMRPGIYRRRAERYLDSLAEAQSE